MAVSFIVENGQGSPDASSYVSVEEATDIISLNIHATADWSALDSASQQALLMWSSRYLDAKTRWRGQKAVLTSGLLWPRKGIVDEEGNLVADNAVPHAVKEAVCEIARWNVAQDRSVPRSQDGVKELKVDTVQIVFDETYRQLQFPTHVKDLLRGLSLFVGGSRISFGRIVRA